MKPRLPASARTAPSAIARAVPVAIALLALLPAPAASRQRVMRQYDEKDGLAVAEIAELAQDSRGFLWIGTIGGLVRFDGHEMRPWAPESLRHVVQVLSTGPQGSVVVGGLSEPLEEITPDGVRPVPGPDGRPIDGWVHATLAGDGSLWIAMPDTLLRRAPNGSWSAWSADAFQSDQFFRVRPGPAGSVFVATGRSLWEVPAGRAPRKLADVQRVNLVEPLPGGGLVFLTRGGTLYELRGGRLSVLIRGSAHGRGLAVRGGVIWASIDQFVYAIRPGEPPEIVAPAAGTPTGRPMIVDREGSLWIGSYHGVLEFPEPETVAWDATDGLPSPTHARFVEKAGDSVWVGTWYGAGLIERRHGEWSARSLAMHSGCFCLDRFGTLWTSAIDSGFVERRGSRVLLHPYPSLHGIYACASRPDGTLWLGTNAGLFLTRRQGGAPERPAGAPPPGWGETWLVPYIDSVLEDRRGMLWVTSGQQIAHAPAVAVADSVRPPWVCETIQNAGDNISGVVEMPSGTIWAATGNVGVLRRTGERWEPIPGARAFPSLRMYGMVPSPSGGVWLLGAGTIVRVVERPGRPEGWEVVERLTAWEGVPSQQASDLFEEPGGRVWLASLSGVIEIPPIAREAPKRPPAVELVDVLADGQRLPLGRGLRLPYRRNRIELHFAALSFRDRNLLRYQIRLRPGARWVEARQPSFLFANLAPGRYAPEIRASLDGADWSPTPARLAFEVLPPWYLRPWALAAFALALAGVLYAAHRVRLGFLLRLERQRTRIAMDLHDEMGSGLGSIGLLAGLASEESVDEPTRRRLAAQIAEAAGDLGGALGDIVWSLREGSDTLESFGVRLAERAARLFPNETPALTTEFPAAWPALKLSIALQRNLQLIAVEALHNAARHAAARRVTLGIEPQGRRWRMWIADDGRGIPPAVLSGRRGGNGLGNMRARSAEIGAAFRVESVEDRGALIEVVFDPLGDAAPPSPGRRPAAR